MKTLSITLVALLCATLGATQVQAEPKSNHHFDEMKSPSHQTQVPAKAPSHHQDAKPQDQHHDAKPQDPHHDAKPQDPHHDAKPQDPHHDAKPKDPHHDAKPQDPHHDAKPQDPHHDAKPQDPHHDAKPKDPHHDAKPHDPHHDAKPHDPHHDAKSHDPHHDAKPHDNHVPPAVIAQEKAFSDECSKHLNKRGSPYKKASCELNHGNLRMELTPYHQFRENIEELDSKDFSKRKIEHFCKLFNASSLIQTIEYRFLDDRGNPFKTIYLRKKDCR